MSPRGVVRCAFFLKSRPTNAASSSPCVDKSTSVPPVNRFSRFQTLSPCRNRTSLFTYLYSRQDARTQSKEERKGVVEYWSGGVLGYWSKEGSRSAAPSSS